LAYIFIGLLAAVVTQKLRPRWTILIIVLVCFEYWPKPWQFMHFPQESIQVYSQVQKNPKIDVLLELPMGNLTTRISLARDQFIDAVYMLSASSLHNKVLLNGYSSFIPPEYTHHVEFITVNFPNADKLATLQSVGIDAILLHRSDFYTPQDFERIKNALLALKVPLISDSPNLALFLLKDWSTAAAVAPARTNR
jgi:hypothetical protein